MEELTVQFSPTVLQTTLTENPLTLQAEIHPGGGDITAEIYTSPPGPPGPPGNQTTYVHSQDISSATWIIVHNLGIFPSVICIDSANDEIVGDIKYISDSEVRVLFAFPTGGKAYLN